MKAYIASCVAGAFAFDEEENLIACELFPKDAKFIAQEFETEKTDLTEKEKKIIEKLKEKNFDEFYFKYQKPIKNAQISDKGEKILSKKFRDLVLKLGWIKNQSELNKLLSDVNILLTKEKLMETTKDMVAMQIIRLVEELDRSLNTICEGLREWYGLYFPEINDLLKDHRKFVKFVAEKTKREKFERNGKKLEIESAGMHFNESDLEEVKYFAQKMDSLYQERENLLKYLEKLMEEIAPNMTALIGAALGAKLVALGGGLNKLAKMPSSRIQVLGAEKALFRYLKGKGKPPKHGKLFESQYILQAPKPIRGKIARTVAAKLAMAVKIDYYSKKDKSKKLKEDLEKSIEKYTNEFKKKGQ